MLTGREETIMDEQAAEKKAPTRWDDPTLYACETARCPCGHEALDHEWNGCEERDVCKCLRSAVHALLASGVIEFSVSPPAPSD